MKPPGSDTLSLRENELKVSFLTLSIAKHRTTGSTHCGLKDNIDTLTKISLKKRERKLKTPKQNKGKNSPGTFIDHPRSKVRFQNGTV